MKAARLAAAAFLLAAAAFGQDEPSARAVDEGDPAVAEVKDALAQNPALADALAERIVHSRLADALTSDTNADARRDAVRRWVAQDPDSAARVALGLARDDHDGTTRFEDSLFEQTRTYFKENPGAERNVFGRLSRAAKQSRLLKQQAEELPEEERREIIRTLFEGTGAQSGKILTMKDPAAGGAPASSFSGVFDRLSAENVHGYSPQLLALQSALNTRRPPGAPRLVETGKLDYATLSYPAYAMNYDANNLETHLRRDRLRALARLAGHPLTARDWKDEAALESRLAAAVPTDRLPPSFQRRAQRAAKARAAITAFLNAAEKSKRPDAITKNLLIELGSRQKEAARWITAAALEETLTHVEEQEALFTPALEAAIDATPAPAPQKQSYRKRGETLRSALARIKTNAAKALELLESESWSKTLAETDRLMTENRALNRTLARDIEDYAKIPFQIAGLFAPRPRWRRVLDDLIVKWLPATAYARDLTARHEGLAHALQAFGFVASGDFDAADLALVISLTSRR